MRDFKEGVVEKTILQVVLPMEPIDSYMRLFAQVHMIEGSLVSYQTIIETYDRYRGESPDE